MIKLKKITIAILVVLLNTMLAYSQKSDSTAVVEKDKRPVKSTFENGVILNSQSPIVLNKKALEFMIQHRFGSFENGGQDLYGIFGPANIRFGLNYGITNKIQAGVGLTKNNTLLDINGKYAILQQSRSGSMPVSVTYYLELGYTYKDDTSRYKEFAQRVSYFHELIIARKFSDKISAQVGASFAHFNIVDSTLGIQHNNIGVSFGGRYKISAQSSIVFEYIHPLTVADKEAGEAKPNLGLGWEIATSSHAFHVFICSSQEILGAYNLVYNQYDFTKPKEGLMLGFNITRNWGF